MVPLFILDKKSPWKSVGNRKVATPMESGPVRKRGVKERQELSRCLGELCSGEVLIKSYACARHKDILVKGKLLVTENWICFYSSIMGWETKTSIHLETVTSIVKQKRALVFPNTIVVTTLHKKYTFSSFLHQDKVHQILLAVWENFNLNKPLCGDALTEHLANLNSRSGNGTRSQSLELSSDVDSSAVDSSSPVSTHSLSLDTSLSTYTACSSGDSDSDWTDASLDVDTSSEEGGASELRNGSVMKLPCSSKSTSEDTSLDHCSNTSLYSSSYCATGLPTREETTPSLSRPAFKNGIGRVPVEYCSERESLRWGWKVWQWLCHSTVHFFKSTHVVNFFILLFIVLLLLSLVTMVCQLCQLEPSLHSYIYWQPWCSCLTSHTLPSR